MYTVSIVIRTIGSDAKSKAKIVGYSISEIIDVVISGYEQAGYSTYSTAFSSLIVMLIMLSFTILYLGQSYWNRKVGRRT
ncbi:hypothetical protein OBCHQ24_04880 [Oceanobacillus iheyensis]|nr:hypothetical protein OBCHQ24_04880 [Oceanobacillus iheyensis]